MYGRDGGKVNGKAEVDGTEYHTGTRGSPPPHSPELDGNPRQGVGRRELAYYLPEVLFTIPWTSP